MLNRNKDVAWHPAYFLAALGAGGIAISFYVMFLHHFIPHKGGPLATWNFIDAAIQKGAPIGQMPVEMLVTFAKSAIILFSLIHVVLLLWNLVEWSKAKGTEAYKNLQNSPAEVQMLAIPLTFAMFINVGFIIGAVFVPNLWDVVEYLFPAAIAGFAIVGFWGLKIFGNYLVRMITSASYRSEEHNHFAPLMAAFAFAMISVGQSASAAMSHSHATIAVASSLSYFFLVLTVMIVTVTIVSGVINMMQHGLAEAASPSLIMLVPISTMIGIELMRLNHGLSHMSGGAIDTNTDYAIFSIFMAIQVLMLMFGFKAMKANGYIKKFVGGEGHSPVAFGLVCPFVGFAVLGAFWVKTNFVATGVVVPFGPAHWAMLSIFLASQVYAIYLALTLSKKLVMHKEQILVPAT